MCWRVGNQREAVVRFFDVTPIHGERFIDRGTKALSKLESLLCSVPNALTPIAITNTVAMQGVHPISAGLV
jgi:hypothetical protein